MERSLLEKSFEFKKHFHESRLFMVGFLSAVLLTTVLIPKAPRFLVCAFHALTGLPCAGCGLTRSFIAMGHGCLTESFAWHPLGPLLYLGVVVILGVALLELVWGKPLLPAPTSRVWVGFIILIMVALFVVWLVRLSFILHHPWLPIPMRIDL